MAVAEESQHRGIGRTIMAELLDFAARHDAPGIWCAARVPAIGFYERFGFFVASELYMEPEIGAHVRMERLSGATSPSLGGA
jgi:ribosomal protein S18 acetylase RimI-like enzyme